MRYQEKYQSESMWYRINHLSIHVRHWPQHNQPKLLMLHGWMDTSASFQFIVDSLVPEWDIYSMDWRGMGLSEHILYGYYDRTMMLSDLFQLVDLLSPHEPIHILGHSFGGMLLSFYAGIFPDRVRSIILAESFGVADKNTEETLQCMANFLRKVSQGQRKSHTKNREYFIEKLMHDNPLLSYGKALYLSFHLLKEHAGQLMLRADSKHQISQPFSYSLSYYRGYWEKITCPILWIQGDFVAHNFILNDIKDSLETRYQLLGSPKRVTLKGIGHMVHWEASQEIAKAIQNFLIEV